MGAVVASASLAVAAGAVAQDPGVQFTAKVTPKNAGTKSKPKNSSLNFKMTVQKPGTTVQFIDLTLPKGLKLSGKGLGNCTEAKLYPDPSGCENSKVGPQGKASAVLAPNNTPLNFTVQPYAQDSNTLLFRIVSESGIVIDTPLTGEITGKGRKLRIEIPEALRCPACPAAPSTEGNDASLTGLDQTFTAKKGGKYLVSSVGCKNRKHKFAAKLTYSARRDGAVVPDPSFAATSVSCRK